jgi:ribonuclease T2
MMRGVRLCLPILALAGLFAQSPGSRGHGGFDYYVLALSWEPEFCATSYSESEACRNRSFGFVLHGLWPDQESGQAAANCAAGSPLSAGITSRLLPLMASTSLIQHEWASHGTCMGVSKEDWATTLARAYESFKTPEVFLTREQVHISTAECIDRIQKANPGFKRESLLIVTSGIYLRELRICLNKDLSARSCPTKLRRPESPELIIRPRAAQ